MFAKVFSQILDSSLAEDWQVRHVFEDMLKLCGARGIVDMTRQAIARRLNMPIEIITRAITELEKPDPSSRTKDENGCRIVRLDSHRDWGWRIVNHDKYREMRSLDDRAEYQRNWDRTHRSHRLTYKKRLSQTITNQSTPTETPTPSDDPRLTPTYAEAEAEAEGGSTNVSGFSNPSHSKNGSHSPSISPSVLVIKNQTELKRVESALDALRAKHQGESWSSSAKAERDRLRSRRSELINSLKFAV